MNCQVDCNTTKQIVKHYTQKSTLLHSHRGQVRRCGVYGKISPAPHPRHQPKLPPLGMRACKNSVRALTANFVQSLLMQAPATHQSKRQTVKLTAWVKPSVKHELQRIAEAEKLSLSRTGAAALEDWLAKRLDMHYASFLEPIIQRALAKGMRAYSSRIAMLEVRSLFITEQTRAITYNILRRQPGMTDEKLDDIMDSSKNVAKRNIGQVSPELVPIMQALAQWLEQGMSEAHA